MTKEEITARLYAISLRVKELGALRHNIVNNEHNERLHNELYVLEVEEEMLEADLKALEPKFDKLGREWTFQDIIQGRNMMTRAQRKRLDNFDKDGKDLRC